jgi:hypothetical protein
VIILLHERQDPSRSLICLVSLRRVALSAFAYGARGYVGPKSPLQLGSLSLLALSALSSGLLTSEVEPVVPGAGLGDGGGTVDRRGSHRMACPEP